MATLKVTIKEELSIGGVDRGSSRVHDVLSVTQVDNRIVTVTTAESDLVKFGSAVASGTFVAASVKYLRISHTGTTGTINLRVLGSGEEYFVQISAGNSFILNNAKMDANATGSQSVNLANISEIKAVASSSSIVAEVFVAS
jgi:hypothetical protein|tara:strand:- start:340 stop:765 length:426 start_codon:yes stop_codon:yes gene_type:complete